MPDEKRRAKAGRERRLGLGDADLGAGHLGRVAADEVVHGLLGRQPAHRRQHAKGIARQEDDVRRMTADAGNLGVGNELDRVGGPRVFGQAGVVVVDVPRGRVDDRVFQHGAEADGVVNLRLASRATA